MLVLSKAREIDLSMVVLDPGVVPGNVAVCETGCNHGEGTLMVLSLLKPKLSVPLVGVPYINGDLVLNELLCLGAGLMRCATGAAAIATMSGLAGMPMSTVDIVLVGLLSIGGDVVVTELICSMLVTMRLSSGFASAI